MRARDTCAWAAIAAVVAACGGAAPTRTMTAQQAYLLAHGRCVGVSPIEHARSSPRDTTCRRLTPTPGLADVPFAADDVDAPVVVLVDHTTASGCELIAATLVARGRAVVVGEKTAGAAVVDVLYEPRDGVHLAVAVGELMAAEGQSVQGRPTVPDFEMPAVPSPSVTDAAVTRAAGILARAKRKARRDLLDAGRAP